ncbi:UNVERIFIED_CONTAM: hypothetical protein HHA_449760 [Hammondia hammondi]|eukprot:XP_008882437.1 hypothetical protein HHA_449760 [Hammondia hammondi]
MMSWLSGCCVSAFSSELEETGGKGQDAQIRCCAACNRQNQKRTIHTKTDWAQRPALERSKGNFRKDGKPKQEIQNVKVFCVKRSPTWRLESPREKDAGILSAGAQVWQRVPGKLLFQKQRRWNPTVQDAKPRKEFPQERRENDVCRRRRTEESKGGETSNEGSRNLHLSDISREVAEKPDHTQRINAQKQESKRWIPCRDGCRQLETHAFRRLTGFRCTHVATHF